MKEIINKVVEFNKIGGQLQFDNCNNKEILNLKIGLIQEELDELHKASIDNNKIEMLDALGDLLYVLIGFAYTYKLEDKLEKAFDLIHDSNMSKFCLSEEEAVLSVENYDLIDIDTYYKKVGKYYIIFRTRDNKILKSLNYQKVNLSNLIDEY